MKSRVKEIFDNINSLDDLRKWVSESADGESLWLEFKSIRKEKESQRQGSLEKHIKTMVAKAMCAFLNTCDGILCLGVEYSKDKGLVEKNEYEGSLYKLLEEMTAGLVEPDAAGFELKQIKDNMLLLFVPKSEIGPHRVCGKVENDYVRHYYIRSGAKSISLPESTIRSLYLSRGRIPDIRIFTDVEILSPNHLILNVFAKPDEAIFVERYYDYERFFMLDGGGERIEYEEDDSLWTDINLIGMRQNNPIYPSSELIKLAAHSITNSTLDNNGGFLPGLMDDLNYNLSADDTRISMQDFQGLKYIVTESGFACDGVSLKKDRRLFVLPDWLGKESGRIYNEKKYGFSTNEKFRRLEEKYSLKVFVVDYYDDNDILGYSENETTNVMSNRSQVSVSQIDSFMERLLKINEKGE